MADTSELNAIVESQCDDAGRLLRRAWGWGGPQGEIRLQGWEDWFSDLYDDIMSLWEVDALRYHADVSALGACDEILDIDCPHEGHIKYIVRIRHRLRPHDVWYDWPCDIDGLEESSEDDSDDEDGLFDFDM